MILKNIIRNVDVLNVVGNADCDILSLHHNSKDIMNNSLFFCINGTKTNGYLYIKEAIKNGAIAIVLEGNKSDYKNFANNANNVIYVFVIDVRKAMAVMAANFFDNPQNKLKIVGITGTNGKTSCSYLIAELLKANHKRVGVIGTNGIYINDTKLESSMTTPDSIQLFEIFNKMVKVKIEYCVMEVSAHAIFFNKIYGIDFAIKSLTNIESDHLDFFKTKQNYAKTKQSFFESGNLFVLNNDDKIGKKIAKNKQKTLTFGKKNTNFAISNAKYALGKTQFDLFFEGKTYQISSKLTGEFNAYNITHSIAVLVGLGFDIEDCVRHIKRIKKLNGRFDVVFKNNDFSIVIDYAHTTDALKNLLTTVKSVSCFKNIIVFGCPGERDTQKRFEMGKLAGEFCKYVILTSDNPASENPKRIMFEISEGTKLTKTKCFFVENRKKAIQKAIFLAKKYKNFNVLIVGKGIENYQIVGYKHSKYSDYESVKQILKDNYFCQK